MSEKEYILFCDESEKRGQFFSNFYGGALVGASHYMAVTDRLNAVKQRLNFFGETKWEKGMAMFCKPFTTASVRYFDHTQEDEAREWLAAE